MLPNLLLAPTGALVCCSDDGYYISAAAATAAIFSDFHSVDAMQCNAKWVIFTCPWYGGNASCKGDQVEGKTYKKRHVQLKCVNSDE